MMHRHDRALDFLRETFLDFGQRGVGMLADEFVETFESLAGEGGGTSGMRSRRNVSRGLSLRQEFFDEAETDRKPVGDLLTRALSCVVCVENPLSEIY